MLEDRLVGASPVTHRIESFFCKVFPGEKREETSERWWERVRPKYYGEALTEDAFDRLKEHKAQREAKETKKKKQQKGNNSQQQAISPRML